MRCKRCGCLELMHSVEDGHCEQCRNCNRFDPPDPPDPIDPSDDPWLDRACGDDAMPTND